MAACYNACFNIGRGFFLFWLFKITDFENMFINFILWLEIFDWLRKGEQLD